MTDIAKIAADKLEELMARLRWADPFVNEPGSLQPRLRNPDGPEAADRLSQQEKQIERLREVLKPFANVATQIRLTGTDNRWLESVLFYMGDDNDPTKWSLTGQAFDNARKALNDVGGAHD